MRRRSGETSRQATVGDSGEAGPSLHPRRMSLRSEQSTSRIGNIRRLQSSYREEEMMMVNPINIKRRRRSQFGDNRRMLLREMNQEVEEQDSDSNIPHAWLGHGTLLRLMDPNHSGNYVIFQRVWRNEYPLIISHVTEKLNMKLWTPNSFSQEFGEYKIDMMNYMTGEIIPDQPMHLFWDGFENLSRRPRDEEGIPMLLRMKEWPRSSSFQSLLPVHMNDLLEGLPLSAYTHPNGLLNFLNYLPNGFLSQELGTELQCAYGTPDFPSMGTRKLDINVADIANILVYVGQTRSGDNDHERNRVLQAIRDAGCDQKSVERVKKYREVPGAIWHVYNAKDINRINDFLKKLAFERGVISRPRQDFVHGEKWFLDRSLRERLRREYKVKVHAILQCVGDAVFIPAGAPHQVRNLKSCIMVKHDFISLQNVKKF